MVQRITRQEATEILKISARTLDNRIKSGQIQTVKDGKRIFILSDELERYLREGHNG